MDSLNKETGLLEDIDEVRKVAIDLGKIVRKLLSLRWNSLLMPPGMLIDVAVIVVSLQSYVQFTTHADGLRDLGEILGMDASEVEANLRLIGVSEVLPSTHPSIPPPPPLPTSARMDLNSPIVQESIVLQRLLSKQVEDPTIDVKGSQQDEPVKLPDELQKFLDSLGS